MQIDIKFITKCEGGKKMTKKMRRILAGVMALLILTLAGCNSTDPSNGSSESQTSATESQNSDQTDGSGDHETERVYKIGACFPTAMNEFWQYDAQVIQEIVAEMDNVELLLQVADDDADKQFSQVENLITQDVDAIIICAVDTASIGPALDRCHEEGIYVVNLRRLSQDCWVDALSLFDQYQKGYLSAQTAFEAAPKGNYVLLNGDVSSLPDVVEFAEAWYDVLQPSIDAGDINIVLEQNCTNWTAEQGMLHTESALSLTNNDIAAVICANDDIAAGAIQALKSAELDTQVIITGADANLTALQYIQDGDQYATIFQNCKKQHEACIELCIRLINGEDVSGDANGTYNNNLMDVPSFKLDVDLIKNADDMRNSVIESGRYTENEVFVD